MAISDTDLGGSGWYSVRLRIRDTPLTTNLYMRMNRGLGQSQGYQGYSRIR